MDKNAKGVLLYALSREKEGMNYYKSKMDSLKNEEAKEIFSMLVEMESGHADFIQNLIDNIDSPVNDITLEDQNNKNVFDVREILEINGGKIDEMTNDMAIVRMAYLIEEDFMKFYDESGSKFQDPETKRVFTMLTAWEKNHRDTLLKIYDEMKKVYWSDMGFEPLY